MQASPDADVKGLLEESSIQPGCLPSSAKESALALWSKADAYYFCNVARVQRVWQVSACASQP